MRRVGRRRRSRCAGIAILPLLLVCAPSPTGAAVRVDATTDCFEPRALSAALERIIGAHARRAGPELAVSVRGRPANGDATSVVLWARATGGGAALEREYLFSAADCGGAAPLLALVLDRFLGELPV